MINHIKFQYGCLSFPTSIKAPVLVWCSAQKDVDAVVRRLMLLKYFAGRALSVHDAMRMSGHYVCGEEQFCLEVQPQSSPNGKNETILYQVRIDSIPPDGFDASEEIVVKKNNSPVMIVKKERDYIDIWDGASHQLHILESCDKSVVSLTSDLPLAQFLKEFMEKWFFYIPVPTAPRWSLEAFGEEVTDTTLWLHHLLEQESNRDRVPSLISFVHPCTAVSTQCSEDGVSVNFTLPETGKVPHQTLDYVVGVVTVLLSDRTSFVALIRPERFIPSGKEENFLKMVCEAMSNKSVVVITQSQAMFQALPSYHYKAEENESELFLTWE